jgi:hypothetical protein
MSLGNGGGRMHKILCGGAKAPKSRKDTDVDVLSLDVQGKNKNINLRIFDIHKSLIATIPEPLLDLL